MNPRTIVEHGLPGHTGEYLYLTDDELRFISQNLISESVEGRVISSLIDHIRALETLVDVLTGEKDREKTTDAWRPWIGNLHGDDWVAPSVIEAMKEIANKE